MARAVDGKTLDRGHASIVVTLAPSFITARLRHELIACHR
jgi:hypothetical protein